MKAELLTDFGIRAVSNKELSHPEKYHERVWGLSTHWGLKVLARGDPKLGSEVLSSFLVYMDKNNLYGLPETITKTGEPKGARHQLWSVAFIPEILDEFRGFSVGDHVCIPLEKNEFEVGNWKIKVSR